MNKATVMSRRAKLEVLIEKEPGDAFLNFGLAMELVKEGLTDLALTRFDRVLEIDPHYTAAHYHKGNALIAAGRLDEARTVLLAGAAAARTIGNAHALSEMEALLDSLGP